MSRAQRADTYPPFHPSAFFHQTASGTFSFTENLASVQFKIFYSHTDKVYTPFLRQLLR